jgi:hypothetical protein
MKNKFNFLLVLAVMVFVIGCSCGNFTDFAGSQDSSSNKPPTAPGAEPSSSSSNKSLTDKAIEQVADGETTGVQECDDLMRFINEQSQSSDDNWVTKGFRDYIFGQIKKALRESMEQNKDDKVKMAEQCRELRKSLETQLNAEKNKK